MIQRIGVINKSTVVSQADAARMVNACNTQVARDVAPAWGRIAVPVVLYPNENTIPANAARIYIFNDSDQAGALGYHTEYAGSVWGTVFARTITSYGCPVLYNPANRQDLTVSSVLSHEVIELLINPYVNQWADGPLIAEGNQYAVEACDAVEANVYQIMAQAVKGQGQSVPVSVSNFLYPEYFNEDTPARAKKDYMGLITTPYTMTEYGYMIVRDTSGNESAIFGAKYPDVLKALNEHSPKQ